MKSIMNKMLIVCFLSILLSPSLFAQLSEEKIKQIDELFLEWNTPDHPGGSIGVMLENKLVYSKAFGLASLEYMVPNTFGTQYNIASVSKQFTAFGIALMHVRGQLSVDDDIRKYLPELPEFEHTITIRHLLHHTSGLRSLHTMLALAGWRADDSRTNADLLRLMQNQKDLNFVPGSEYMYCNTGYMFMSEIMERISEVEFSEWMQNEVFEPMGMNHTYVEEFYNRVVKNNATSYQDHRDGTYSRSTEYWGYVGSGNIHTNVQDLLIWLKQLRKPDQKWEDAMMMMRTTDPFNDGSHNKYAFGVNVEKYKNEDRIQHGGSIGAFKSQVATYPKKDLDIVVLSNFSTANPGGKVNSITDIVLEKEANSRRGPKIIPMKVSEFDLKSGRYSLVTPKNKKLDIFRIGFSYYAQIEGEKRNQIYPTSDRIYTTRDESLTIEFKSDAALNYKTSENREAEKLNSFEASTEELNKLTGNYWSPELETQYRLSVKDGELMGYHTRHGWFKIRKVRDGEYNGSPSYFNFFKVKTDKRGRVKGIYVTNSRVRNLWMEKTK